MAASGPDEHVRVYRAIAAVARRPNAWATRLRVDGRERIPREGGLLIVSNHMSWWDPVILGSIVPRPIHYLAKKEVFKGPFTRWFFTNAGAIPVDRQRGGNVEAMAAARDVLDAGGCVGIFPEGTRAAPGRTLPPRTGAARLALATGVDVMPVAILSDRFWGRGMGLPKFGEKVYVAVGETMRVPRDAAGADDPDVARKVTEDVFGRVRALLDRTLAAREAGEAWPAVDFKA